MGLFSFGGVILDLLIMVFEAWNSMVDIVFGLLTDSPENFKNGAPWQIIEEINPIFVAVGSSLVVIFFVIGFCSESIDVKEEMRLEKILTLLVRLGLAEFFVANNVTIMKAVFTSVGNLVSLLSMGNGVHLKMTRSAAEVIADLGFCESILMLILTVVLALVILVCGFFLIYTVYFRFLKIMVIVPLGSLAYSTMSGNRMVTSTAITYTKYFLSVAFEAVTMALAIIVCNSLLNAGMPIINGDDGGGWTAVLLYLCEVTFGIALTVGSVKGAQNLTSKALGL